MNQSIRQIKFLGLVKRSFKYLDQDKFLLLYKTLVRPILEYASPVWSPNKIKDIIRIEGIQWRATNLILSIKDLSYPERLRRLNLTTLE